MIGVAAIVISAGLIVAQLAIGSAFLGNDRPAQRSKAPFHYWFIIGVESLAVIVGILAIRAFK